MYANHAHRNLIVRDECGDILKHTHTVFKKSSFGVPFPVKKLFAMQFMSQRQRTRTKKMESNLTQSAFKINRFLIWNQQTTQKKMRVMGVVLVFIKVTKVHFFVLRLIGLSWRVMRRGVVGMNLSARNPS